MLLHVVNLQVLLPGVGYAHQYQHVRSARYSRNYGIFAVVDHTFMDLSVVEKSLKLKISVVLCGIKLHKGLIFF
jgi:hypothetical protein